MFESRDFKVIIFIMRYSYSVYIQLSSVKTMHCIYINHMKSHLISTDKPNMILNSQRAVLEPAMQGRDMIGRARTGTGKTLAFGIPIMDKIIKHNDKYG